MSRSARDANEASAESFPPLVRMSRRLIPFRTPERPRP